jgi:hypothetical protein
VDLSFILAAAEHAAEEHHKSELPFFIAGGLLASFAVLISVFGFKRPDFPPSDAAARGVMAVSAVLVAGAMAMIIYVNT